MGAFPAQSAGNRAIRSNSSAPCGGLRDFRFYPLRVLVVERDTQIKFRRDKAKNKKPPRFLWNVHLKP
jgi:hypothetical protein